MSATQAYPSSTAKWFTEDAQFDGLYPVCTQLLSRRHWTPLHIARTAVNFLVPQKGVRVLDIGSGAGKFCLAGAWFKPEAFFYGVEQREHLVDNASDAKDQLGLKNVHFLQGDFSQQDFKQYDHFYFFNAFYENLSGKEKIDNKLSFSEKIYSRYTDRLFEKLKEMPAGTRVAAYHTLESQVPPGFRLVEEHAGGLLKCWTKKK